VIQSAPNLFFPTFFAAIVLELVLFFVARNVAENGNNAVALPLLALYSLLSGYTLSGLVYVALGTQGVGSQGIAIAALGCGVTFIVARNVGSNLSEQDGMALTKTIGLGVMALLVVLVGQLVFSLFGVYTPTWLEIAISGLGVSYLLGRL
jgi:FtsH-binding integral membrane protein